MARMDRWICPLLIRTKNDWCGSMPIALQTSDYCSV